MGMMEMARMLSATFNSEYVGSKIMLLLLLVRRRVIGGYISPMGSVGGSLG